MLYNNELAWKAAHLVANIWRTQLLITDRQMVWEMMNLIISEFVRSFVCLVVSGSHSYTQVPALSCVILPFQSGAILNKVILIGIVRRIY
jgi:hypothetical protein